VLTRLRPIFALFVRSLREQSRAKFTSLSRGGIALLLLLFIAMNERSFTHQSAPGQSVLIMLVMVNFFVIAIFGLSTFASAITEEKEDDTLGLLQMTRLNPLAILLGKSTARLCEGLLLLAVQVPFTMLCITLGGVSMEQVLRCYAILAAFLFFLCNVALLWSVVCRRSSRATSMTTLTGIVIYVLPLFLLSIGLASRFTGRKTQTWLESFSQWCISINPVFDLARTVEPRGGLPFTTDSLTASLIGGVICFGLAWLLFAPCCNSGAEVAAPRRDISPASNGRRRAAHPRAGRRAIAWKDFHFLTGGWRGLLIRSVVYAAIGLLFVWWMATIERPSLSAKRIGVMLWIFGLLSFSVEFGLLSSRMFGTERKRKTLGTLYTLPLGTGRLIREKILGALPQLIPSITLALLGLALIYGGPDGSGFNPSDSFLAGCTLTVSSYIFFAVLVMYLSLRMRRAPFATGLCLMFLLYIIAGFFMSSTHTHGSDTAEMLGFSVLVWIATVAVASRIPGRIAVAAAAE
jgi:ABC-type Na+ efflux pump permease subunit